ncbi:hypothetical protein LCGC14_0318910 [marine sediment metagenome]|uniref:Uncharacterized protein n=1 Tax=marine sediment metagenome TaxID=412755 RepID=A0A0F9U2S0_9ZZZZ
MTQDQFVEILENYEYTLVQNLVDCVPFERSFTDHLKKTCLKAIDLMKSGKTEEAMRWLGFIQGAMWRMGLRTIEELRDDNRG